jgi:hypothetical protein
MAAMDDPTETKPTVAPSRTADVDSGDRAPNRPTRLARPPSERYASVPAPASASLVTRALRPLGVALAGAAVIAFLGGPLSMTAGLLVVAVVVGFVLGSVLRPATALAVSLAIGSVVVGLVGVWLFARAEGGVLDPLTYFADVQGLLAPVQLLLAALAAVVSGR